MPLPPPLAAAALPIAGVHADPWLLAVHKPAGLLRQPGRGPALAACLFTRLQRDRSGARLVHRLDQATAGLLFGGLLLALLVGWGQPRLNGAVPLPLVQSLRQVPKGLAPLLQS